MKYLFIAFFAIIIFFACENPSKDSKFIIDPELTDSINDARYTRQPMFDRKKFMDIVQNINEDSLVGVWVDSIVLFYEEGIWYGWKPVDKINRIRLYGSSKYKWEEVNTYSKLDTVKYGQYWTSNYNDSSYLQLMYNHKGDTLFNHGDTAFGSSFLIDYFKDDTLLLRAYNTATHSTKDEAHLMIRKESFSNLIK